MMNSSYGGINYSIPSVRRQVNDWQLLPFPTRSTPCVFCRTSRHPIAQMRDHLVDNLV